MTTDSDLDLTQQTECRCNWSSLSSSDIVQSDWEENSDDNSKTRKVSFTVTLTQVMGPKHSQLSETQVRQNYKNINQWFWWTCLPVRENFHLRCRWCSLKATRVACTQSTSKQSTPGFHTRIPFTSPHTSACLVSPHNSQVLWSFAKLNIGSQFGELQKVWAQITFAYWSELTLTY